MSQETNSEINNLQIHLAKVKSLQKELEELSKADAATIGQLRQATVRLQVEKGKLDESLGQFFEKEGLPLNGHIIDVIVHFWNKSKKTLVLQ